MAQAVVFVCPQCGLGRQLPPYAAEGRVRCLSCEASFRSDGYLFTAADWPQLSDPDLLISLAAGMNHELSARKWRLLACAIGREAFDWCRNPWFRDALQLAERWADEGEMPRNTQLCRRQLAQVELPPILRDVETQNDQNEYHELEWVNDWDYLSRAHRDFQQQQERERFAWVQLALRCVNDNPRLQRDDTTESNRPLLATFLRELIPNPFLSLNWNPDWLTSTVRDLASHIYIRREFTAMPILADALQDAGCDDEQILQHCRESKPHTRGCWVLDAILGK